MSLDDSLQQGAAKILVRNYPDQIAFEMSKLLRECPDDDRRAVIAAFRDELAKWNTEV